MDLSRAATPNILLSALSPADYALLEPSFVRVRLPVNFQLHGAGTPIEHIYFPEDGVASIVAAGVDGRLCEVGIFGRDGMSGTAVVLGTDRAPHQAFMQVAGVAGLRLSAGDLRAAMNESATLQASLLRYVQTAMIQTASSATAAASQTIDQRLARWLVMCHDRLDGNDIHLTHDFISMMLGTRRAGVTEAVHVLEGASLISTSRGHIVIDDRAGLERLAGEGYGLAEAEYRRLVGHGLRRSGPGDPGLRVAPARIG